MIIIAPIRLSLWFIIIHSAGKVVSPALLNKLQKALGISSLEDWYHVVKSALERELGYKGSLKKYGDLEDFLRAGFIHFDS